MSGFPRPFGPYTLRAELGRGGMGVVYRAWDPSVDREVAVKVCTQDADETETARLVREAQVLASLNHPHLVTLLDVGSHKGAPYFVMELVEGENLGACLAREKQLQISTARDLVQKLALALGALHSREVVHRDVKPANVLLTLAGEPVLADLGLARGNAMKTLTLSGTFLGTPAYLSPEQITGKDVGPPADVYSLGVLAFELISGRLPFPAKTPVALFHAHIRRPPPLLSSVAPEVDEGLEAIVARCLAKDPRERYEDGNALALALETTPVGAPVAEGAASRAAVWLLVVATAALGAAGMTVWLAWSQTTPQSAAGTAPIASQQTAPELQQGWVAFAAHDLDLAYQTFRQASDDQPSRAEGWFGLGEVARREGRRASARRWLGKALKLDPTLAAAHVSLGQLELRDHDPLAARASLDRALAHGAQPGLELALLQVQVAVTEDRVADALSEAARLPANPPGAKALVLATAQHLTRDSPGALETLKGALAADPCPRHHALRLTAGLAAKRTDEEQAEWRREALSAFPRHAELIAAVAISALNCGATAELRELLQRHLTAERPSPQLTLARARLLHDEGAYEAALADLEVAAQELPAEPRLARLRCNTLLRSDEPAEALQQGLAIAEPFPQDAKVQELLYALSIRVPNLYTAREAGIRRWTISPSAEHAQLVADLNFALDDLEGALLWAGKGLERDATNELLLLTRNAAELLSGDRSRLAELEAWTNKKSSRSATAYLVRYHLGQGDLEAARLHLASLAGLPGTDPSLDCLRGDHALARGAFRQALENYELALAQQPCSTDALSGIARVHQALGAPREARFNALLALEAIERTGIAAGQRSSMAALVAETPTSDLGLERSPEVLVREAQQLIMQRDAPRASALARAALLTTRTHGRAWLCLARISIARNFNVAAEAYLLRARSFLPRDPEVLGLSALFAASLGDTEGRDAALSALASLPPSPWANLTHGELAGRAGRENEASRYLRAAHEQEPGNPRFTAALATLLLGQKRFAEVDVLLEGSKAVSLRLKQADLWLSVDKPARVESGMRALLAQHPTCALAWTRLASAHHQQRQPAPMRKALVAALQNDALQHTPRVALINLELECGNLEAVEQAFDTLVATSPPHLAAQSLEAFAKVSLDNDLFPEHRTAWAERAAELNPGSLKILQTLLLAYMHDENEVGLLSAGERILAIDPGNLAARLGLARAALNRGDLQRVRRLSAELIALHPDAWVCFELRGKLRSSDGDLAGARADFLRAEGLAPEESLPKVRLLELALERRDWERVRHYASAVLACEILKAEHRTLAQLALAQANQEASR